MRWASSSWGALTSVRARHSECPGRNSTKLNVIVALLTMSAAACAGETRVTAPAGTGIDTSGVPMVTRLDFDGTASSVIAGDSVRLKVIARTAAGVEVKNVPVAWATNNPSVVAVAQTGFVRGVSRGSATIAASVGTATVTKVLNVRAARLNILPASPNSAFGLLFGQSLSLTPEILDARQQPLPYPADIRWISSHPEVVAVSANGSVTAISAGSAVITALLDGLQAGVLINVTSSNEPATVRLVHGINALGALRFRTTSGSEVALSYGQAAEIALPPAMTVVTVLSMPDYQVAQSLAPNKHYTFIFRPWEYDFDWLVLSDAHPEVPSGQAMVRIVSSSYQIGRSFKILAVGAGATATDFSPSVAPNYILQAPGAFDIVVQDQTGSERFRIRNVTISANRATTLVIIGDTLPEIRLLTFVDP